MKTVPFTPGPWAFGEGRGRVVLYGAESRVVGEVTHALARDKRLIETGPDMFAALERCAVALGGISAGVPITAAKLVEVLEQADRALLKAGWSK